MIEKNITIYHFEYDTPRWYEVKFGCGKTIKIKAKSAREAKILLNNEQNYYDTIISAKQIGL